MLQFLGEFVKAEPAAGKGASARPARVQVHFLNQQTEWFTVEELIQVRFLKLGTGVPCVVVVYPCPCSTGAAHGSHHQYRIQCTTTNTGLQGGDLEGHQDVLAQGEGQDFQAQAGPG